MPELTERDRSIVDDLHAVRLLSLEQVARTWWSHCRSPARQAKRRLSSLHAEGHLVLARVRVRPLLPLKEPLATWNPGDPCPFGTDSLLSHVQSRWAEPAVPTLVCHRLCPKATLSRLTYPLQATHDLHMSELFLRHRARERTFGIPQDLRWVTEDQLRRRDDIEMPMTKLPDAVLVDARGVVQRIVEFAGAYPSTRLWVFHEACEKAAIPYELW